MNDTPLDESRADFMNLRLGFLRFDLAAEKSTNYHAAKEPKLEVERVLEGSRTLIS